ncbi:hypothetical protein BZL53_02525 [Flavobacterium columnare]|nr:hypothetical protein BZL53_02525 [Flavobacterium columnare]
MVEYVISCNVNFLFSFIKNKRNIPIIRGKGDTKTANPAIESSTTIRIALIGSMNTINSIIIRANTNNIFLFFILF